MDLKSVLVCLSLLLSHALSTGPEHDKVVVCYVATWAVYRPERGSFSLDHLDPELCTHLVYAFAGLDQTTNTIKSLDPWQDLKDDYGKGGYEKITGMKVKYPHLKVTLAIGGWNEGSEKYSKLAASPEMRKTFINSVVAFLKKYNFDGLDLDWEYPGKRGGIPQDKENFVTLIRELKDAFAPHKFLLTAALGASKETIDVGYDIKHVAKHLDFVHMMCYDYHGTWDGLVGANAPLSGLSSSDPLSVEKTVDYMMSLGAPREKLVLGLPLYGRTFVREDLTPGPPEMGVTKVKPMGFAGPYTREAGFMGYNEICASRSNKSEHWKQLWDETSTIPYMYQDDKYITFDNQRSIAEKVRYAINKGLRGLMVWSIDTDDFQGDCLPETDTYVGFNERLRKMESSPFFDKVLPEIKLPKDDDLQSSDSNWYRIIDGRVKLVTKARSSLNFPLMRTINEAVVVSQQEKSFFDRLEGKIKEKEEENAIDNSAGDLRPSYCRALLVLLSCVIVHIFV